MSSRLTKKSLVSASGRLVKTPCGTSAEIGLQDAHAAHEDRHLGGGQRQKLRAINEQFLRRYRIFGFQIVAEPVRGRFEYGE